MITITLAACGPSGTNPAAEVVFDTLSQGTVVVRNPTGGLWEEGGGWRAVEELRIGAVEGEGPDVFGQIREVALDGAGRIYVLEGQAREIRVFDADGTHVRTIGGPGEGPGELSNPTGMTFGPDGRLWVSDPGNARYTVYDPAGDLVETHRRSLGGWAFHWDGDFTDAGELLDVSRAMESTHMVRHRPEAGGWAAVDSFPLPDEAENRDRWIFRLMDDRGLEQFLPIPFAPRPIWTLDGSGGIWAGSADEYRLYNRSPQGDTLRIVERRRGPDPVLSVEVESILEERGLNDRLDPPILRQLTERIPARKPHFDQLFTDDGGYLWVGRTGSPADPEDPSTFDVFDPEGVFLGEVRARIPVEAGLLPRPRVYGSRLVGVFRDELGVPHVVVYR